MNKVDVTTNALMEQEYEVFNFVEETAMCGNCRECKNVCPFGAELLVKTFKVVP